MKRKIFALCFIGLISSGFLFAQNLGLKESFFQKITSKYGDVKELSANFEMNMSVMGTSMKMPMKMWVKVINCVSMQPHTCLVWIRQCR